MYPDSRPTAASRQILRSLRALMARRHESDQNRLNDIVTLIASGMIAEVCSLYLRLPSRDELELCASEGLHPAAVHKTRLRYGEGLVGDVAANARPLSLKEARSHPSFVHRPETREEAYTSFLGVPVLRNGRVAGVLSIQNRRARAYGEDDLETLQTIAMILAEFTAGKTLTSVREEPADSAHLTGRGWTRAIALGHIVLHRPKVSIEQLIADSPMREHERLDKAIFSLRQTIDALLRAGSLSAEGEHQEIFETYRMFANDRTWIARLHEAIDTGLTAEAAVERVRDGLRAGFAHQSDPYLRERLHDMDDLSHRLLRELTGRGQLRDPASLPKDAILAARNMSPAALLDYQGSTLRGVVLEEGSPLAHATIVARALGIALVGRLDDLLLHARDGMAVIADGSSGQVYLNPQQNVIDAYAEKVRLRASRHEQYLARAQLPAQTKDRQTITLMMTAGLRADLPHLAESGAAGIGLFRTELHFMVAATMPRLAEQTSLYSDVLAAAAGRPVVFRTLDIGGDKMLPYMSERHSESFGENPALGWRALRISLDRPALLRYQLRALLKAAAKHKAPLNILFPLVSEAGEFLRARALLQREITRAEKLRLPLPPAIKTGAMLEVPSLLFHLDGLAGGLDFLSVGSNDLLQFLFAADRGHPRLGERYDTLSAPVIRVLDKIARFGQEHTLPFSLCGEMAANPLEALALCGLGFREIAMPPAAIGPVREALRAAKASDLRSIIRRALASPDPLARPLLQAYADKNDIPLAD